MSAPSLGSLAPRQSSRVRRRAHSEAAAGTPSEYRPDIDGLRAIAVVAVLLYHVEFELFAGGFVGVDVFFVISGFLITNLLTIEFDRTGKIDLVRFYTRRAKRLLPSLFATLAATTLVATWLLTPQRLTSYGASLFHSVVSFSNVHFYQESGYFDVDAELKPLLHTWSLGVEEQFYLIWPLVVLGLSAKKALRPIGYVILFAGSLALAQRYIGSHPSAVFFLAPFRVFEFAIGALLVSLGKVRFLANKSAAFAFGIGLIVYSVMTYGPDTPFPGAAVLVPCVGAALCIVSGRDAALARPLRLAPVVGLGRLSYALYLVHWPVIVFTKYRFRIDDLSLAQSCIVIAISLVLALALHRLVEQPLRHSQGNVVFFGLIAGGVTLMLLAASMWVTQGWPSRPFLESEIANSISVDEIEQGRQLRYSTRDAICESRGWEVCNEPDATGVNGLIIGDSHAIDALNAFHAIFPGHNLATSIVGGCPPHVAITEIVSPTHAELDECTALNIERHDPELLLAQDYIVISVRYGWYTADRLRDYLSFLDEVGVEKVIVVGGYLELTEELPELVNRGMFLASETEAFVQQAGLAQEDALESLSLEFGYLFMSKRDVFCQSDGCMFFNEDQIPFSYDEHHLSFEFGTAMGIHHRDEITNFLETVLPT